MKTQRRHELQTNVLAETLANGIETMRPYSRVIAGLVVLAVTAVFIYSYSTYAAQSRLNKSWDQYFFVASGPDAEKQLQLLIDEHQDDPLGQWSRARLADMQLVSGINELLKDREAANRRLEQAARNFSQLRESRDPDARERALLGLAKAHEAAGDLATAETDYKTLASEFPQGPFHGFAVQRAEALKSQSAREFYSWVKDYVPAIPSNVLGPGATGDRPAFDEKALNPFPVDTTKDNKNSDPFFDPPGTDKARENSPDGAQDTGDVKETDGTAESPTQKLEVTKPADAAPVAPAAPDTTTTPAPKAPASAPKAPAKKP